VTSSPAELRARLPGLMLRDQGRLTRLADRARSERDPAARDRAFERLAGEVAAAEARLAARASSVPVISYPAELPVSQRKDELATAIRDHQVVIIAGETGSGKTTQLPKICLELGRGVTGQIGHTQPRRIAARTVAERIAAELGTELGTVVGYKVRFADSSSDGTLVKVMTDGILLTEMQRDRLLLRYDTLIIDEAHERSLNIDFILGYLTQLLPRRPDLKIIITSATIDPERFSRHFSSERPAYFPSNPESEHTKSENPGQDQRAPVAGLTGLVPAGLTGSGPAGRTVSGPAGLTGLVPDRLTGSGPAGQAGAPTIEVSGRTYPVEVRYRPLADPDQPETEPRDQVQAIIDAVDELRAAGQGDILVFLSGEREIRDTADALADLPGIEVLPLYARLSVAEQYRVFQPHTGRRVVLATNVAETSLTVPGIRYVIDPGTARISRYSQRTKVQRLPIDAISQASANQRKGRCGRTSDGICIRLYSEEDYASRPEFTDPEILRTNLASVILRMAALDLGAMADFPFLDPPDARNVTDGVRLLEELGAIVPGKAGTTRLTDTGRKLAELPVDPRLGRMILESGRNGCAREVLVITAALSIQDPRERPADARDAADAMHRRFAEPGSDFLAFVTLWDYLREQQRELSGSAFRRMCRREYLHYLRVREWQDVYGQLRQAAREFGVIVGRDAVRPDEAVPGVAANAARQPRGKRSGGSAAVSPDRGRPAEPQGRYSADLADRVHQSLLAGLLSHLGMQDADRKPGERGRRGPVEFAGARGARFAIFPDSPLARKPPAWVMAAELVETSRLWARTVAKIEPEWAEQLAGHLVRRSYSEPRWDARQGAVMAVEKVSLYGMPIIAARQVNYDRVDPAAARDLFISGALVERDWETHHAFFRSNEQMLAEAEQLEHKARRRGIVADDTAIFDFYDRRIPKTVTSARHFDSWWKKTRPAEPDLLNLSLDDLVSPSAGEVRAEDYPASWGEFPLSYTFAPGEAGDGVSADIPLETLNQGSGLEVGWQVPGMREELVTELIRGLPKDLRRLFVPAPDTARAVLAELGEPHGDLLDALSRQLGRLAGVPVPTSAFDLSRLPAHLRVTFRILDGATVVATGKDLAALRRELRPRLQAVLADAAADITRTGLKDWNIGTLPRVFRNGQVTGYPALADAGDGVDVRMFQTEAEASRSTRLGTRRLILLRVPSGARSIAGRLPVTAKMAMSRHPYSGAVALLDDCAACAADQVVADAGGPAWDADGFARLMTAARDGLAVRTAKIVDVVARVLAEAHEVEVRLTAQPSPALAPAFADMRAQLAALIYSGFVAETGAVRLPDLIRYLRAMVRRLEKLPGEQGRDADRMAVVHRVTDDYLAVLAGLPPPARDADAAQAVRWMIEELRVNLFAQILGTPGPVSEKRILTAIHALAEN
jgi:ATP-dependent helicase HrpA